MAHSIVQDKAPCIVYVIFMGSKDIMSHSILQDVEDSGTLHLVRDI